MKHDIYTKLGKFEVHLPYKPSPDDPILDKLKNTIDEFASNPPIDEDKLQSALYDCTRAGDGAGVYVILSLKERRIEFSNM